MHRISAIAAIGKDTRVLGKDGDLVFKIPADLTRFRLLTTGHPVVMGRKTWESLPASARPLPNRTNIVITRQADYAAPGATLASSAEEALAIAKRSPGSEEIFVIGGERVFSGTLAQTDRLYLTLVLSTAPGDVYFPAYPQFQKEIEREEHLDNDPPYLYVTLER